MAGTPDGRVGMSGKVVVVTGANSGLGKATATALARAGATVVMACRDLDRGGAALAEVRTSSGSDQVHLMQLDLASQDSIRGFAESFVGRFSRLDVLVNNAGVASPKRRLTADGFELHLAVHHLGPFLLTTLLLPVLESSAPSRVLIVAGAAQRTGRIRWDDLQCDRNYSLFMATGQSKVASLLFMRALAHRVRGVTVNAIDPGSARTGINRELPAPRRALARLTSRSPDRAAQTSIYLASSPDVAAVTDRYFRKMRVVKANPISLDDSHAQRLWQISTQLTAASATAP